MGERINLKWTLGWTAGRHQVPQKWIESTVPGAVQLDWAKAEGWGPYWWGDNFKQYAWMENTFWHYRTRIPAIRRNKDERLYLVSKGIDYSFVIKLNNDVIHEQEGMFTPVDLDLTEIVHENDLLDVVVLPAPKSKPDPEDLFKASDYGRQQANQSCKPPMNYGWDFVCRLIPLGIYDETFLEVRPALDIVHAEVGYELADDFSYANVRCQCLLSKPGSGKLRWSLVDHRGARVIEEETSINANSQVITAQIADPELWWPHDQGDPVLYTSRLDLLDDTGAVIGKNESCVGFRRVRLVPNEGAFPQNFRTPTTQCLPPITLEINGRKIFCKGSNWVSPEIFPGLVTAERYRPLLEFAKSANLNLLRLWGGSMIGKESFYDICDELGIMLWQEFPLSCNRYEGTPGYLKILDQESRSIITRLRSRASVVIWCGGNELFSPWSGMNEQDLAIRLLNRNCFDLDPQRPFLPTSPIMGIGHGDYLFKEDMHGREVFQILRDSDCTAYVEFGVQGASAVDHLNAFIPESELFPPRHGTAWQTHHGVASWGPDGWLKQSTIEDYFGPSPDLETLVAHSQLMQCEGYKCLFEEARRHKPRASMAVNWLFNEPWPSAVNLSLVSWPEKPKPALNAVGASCRPVLASARIAKFRWSQGEDFSPELWILNDSPRSVAAGCVEAILVADGTEHLLLTWNFPAVPANENLKGPTANFKLPLITSTTMELVVRVTGHPEWESRYTVVYRSR